LGSTINIENWQGVLTLILCHRQGNMHFQLILWCFLYLICMFDCLIVVMGDESKLLDELKPDVAVPSLANIS
jgi:hypothetical protein